MSQSERDERQRVLLLRAFVAGFLSAGEGWNGEYGAPDRPDEDGRLLQLFEHFMKEEGL